MADGVWFTAICYRREGRDKPKISPGDRLGCISDRGWHRGVACEMPGRASVSHRAARVLQPTSFLYIGRLYRLTDMAGDVIEKILT